MSLVDTGDAGLSIGDTLIVSSFSPAYGHEFKKDLTGTLTVADGLGQSVVVNVEYVNVNTLKVTGFATSNKDFKNNSNSLVVTAATGVVNQDQLAYNVAKSTDVSLNADVVAPVVGNGIVSNATADLFVVNGTVFTADASTLLKDSNGNVLKVGKANIFGTDLVENGAQVTVNGNVITLVKTASAVAASDAIAFKTAHAAALALTTATVTVTDEVRVDNAITAHGKLSAAAKALVTTENTLLGNLKTKITALKDQALVTAELAKVNSSLELVAGSTANVATIKTAVEGLVDLNKVNVGVVQVGATNEWTVTLTSKAASASTANKVITVTVALTADKALVNAELAKVGAVVLPTGTVIAATDVKALVEAEVVKLIDLNKVTIVVTKGGNDNTYNVALTSKAAAASTSNKDINVTVAP